MQLEKYNHPTTFVIFGGTGDLAKTKLLPALLDLYVADVLPDRFRIVGVARKTMSDEKYRATMLEHIQATDNEHDLDTIQEFCTHIVYQAGDFATDSTYHDVARCVTDFDKELGQCTNKLYYLAVPPELYAEIFRHVDQSSLMELCDEEGSWSRLLVEKPFGKDLETAEILERDLCNRFKEEQIYRIDHYLAKNAIENIISIRFANTVFADSWSVSDIESITIRLLETKDTSTRGSFYDGVGALRDVGQNHMLQILALLTMPPVPVDDVGAMRSARAQMLEALQPPTQVVRAQYQGYLDVEGVNPASTTETYFALTTTLDDAKWAGVPLKMEAGKAMNTAVSEAVVTFKPSPECRCNAEAKPHYHKNVLTITFAPQQTIAFKLWVKKPGFHYELVSQLLELVHEPGDDAYSPEAYERVLYDCIRGNQMRFVSGREVMAAWEFITPILGAAGGELKTYSAGSDGPSADGDDR